MSATLNKIKQNIVQFQRTECARISKRLNKLVDLCVQFEKQFYSVQMAVDKRLCSIFDRVTKAQSHARIQDQLTCVSNQSNQNELGSTASGSVRAVEADTSLSIAQINPGMQGDEKKELESAEGTVLSVVSGSQDNNERKLYTSLDEAAQRTHRKDSGSIYFSISLEGVNQLPAQQRLINNERALVREGSSVSRTSQESNESLPEVKAWQDVTSQHITAFEGYQAIRENETIRNVYLVDAKTGQIPINRVTKNPEGPIYNREIALAVKNLLTAVNERFALPGGDAIPYFWSGVSVAGDDLQLFLDTYPEATDLVKIEGGKKKIPGESVAAFLAAKLQGATLESLLDEQHLMPPSPKEYALNPDVQRAWAEVSKVYANLVAHQGGEVRVFLKDNKAGKGSVWSKKEFPTLIRNPNVVLITSVDPLSGKENIVFERSPATNTMQTLALPENNHQEGVSGIAAKTFADTPRGDEVLVTNEVTQQMRVGLTVIKIMSLLMRQSASTPRTNSEA